MNGHGGGPPQHHDPRGGPEPGDGYGAGPGRNGPNVSHSTDAGMAGDIHPSRLAAMQRASRNGTPTSWAEDRSRADTPRPSWHSGEDDSSATPARRPSATITTNSSNEEQSGWATSAADTGDSAAGGWGAPSAPVHDASGGWGAPSAPAAAHEPAPYTDNVATATQQQQYGSGDTPSTTTSNNGGEGREAGFSRPDTTGPAGWDAPASTPNDTRGAHNNAGGGWDAPASTPSDTCGAHSNAGGGWDAPASIPSDTLSLIHI